MYKAELYKDFQTAFRFNRRWVRTEAKTLAELQNKIINLKEAGYYLMRVINPNGYNIF